ncbi:hypothetical protein ABLE91_05915 [Aquabacter sp. CN5-332]|uniref:hypothetical protein n=1 Tax=Aquabacter sp. CN5-332 TaxID=3156608 RepID=UPI0032B48246
MRDDDAVEYLKSIVPELCQIAKSAKLPTVAYLLGLAADELRSSDWPEPDPDDDDEVSLEH